MSKVLLIGGHRKSGTTLLHSLFDGHSSLYAPPHDLNILYAYYPEWTKEKYSKNERKGRLERVILDDWLNFYKEVTSESELQAISKKMRSHFYDTIDNYDLGDINSVLQFAVSLVKKIAPEEADILVVKETSSEMYATQFLSDQLIWKFLHLFRDPRDNYAALQAGQVKYYSKLGDEELDTISSTIIRYKMGHNWKEMNLNAYGEEKYHVLRFEDLVQYPKKYMQKVADWLGITWNESLMQPTKFGSSFEGNNYEGKKFDGISTENLGRWNERIADNKAAILEACLKDEMKQLDYERSFEEKDAAIIASEWYARMNHKYFFSDRFAD
jgi:hypothetical protein